MSPSVRPPLGGTDVRGAPSPSQSAFASDTRDRQLRDLRISVTDRCNFRCVYCMPKETFGGDFAFLGRDELLTFEEMTRLARIAVSHGVVKIRLTGGEPLLRKGLDELVGMLAKLKTPAGNDIDIARTTNGSALAAKAKSLKDAGLTRVTVSLDSLDDATFRAINDVDFPVAKVLQGLDVAAQVGLGPIKVNMVVKRGLNDQDVVAMACHFKDSPHILRFVEFMDVGTSNDWRRGEVVPSAEIIELINAELRLDAVAPRYDGETATRWQYRDGGGEIGVISSVTRSFCHSCTRARISTEGKLYTCLFATGGDDLRALMRGGCSDEELSAVMGRIWSERKDHYSELRSAKPPELSATVRPKIEMSYIGG